MTNITTVLANRCASIALIIALLASPALRAEVSVYIIAPGDSLWRIAQEQLSNPNDWKKLLTVNEMSDKSRLEVGQALKIPVDLMKPFEPVDDNLKPPANLPTVATHRAGEGSESGSAPSATEGGYRRGASAVASITMLPRSAITVAATYGDVSQSTGDSFQKLAVKTELNAGDKVRTGANSSVNLLLKDGSMLVLLANTEVSLASPIELHRGAIEYSYNGEQEADLIHTQSATLRAKSARMRVATGNSGNELQLEVQQGQVIAVKGDDTRSVSAGLGIKTSAGQPLPTARHGLMRPDTRNLSKSSVNGNVNLTWPAIDQAVAYRAQLVFAAETYLILRDQIVTEPALHWSNISPGRYTLRLRSIDQDGLEGLDSNLSFFVQGALTAPQSQTPLNGATLPNATPWIAWQRVPEANTYVLQVSRSANFTKDVDEHTHLVNNNYRYQNALPAGTYYWRVMSVSRKGVKSTFGEVRSFIIGAK